MRRCFGQRRQQLFHFSLGGHDTLFPNHIIVPRYIDIIMYRTTYTQQDDPASQNTLRRILTLAFSHTSHLLSPWGPSPRQLVLYGTAPVASEIGDLSVSSLGFANLGVNARVGGRHIL